MTIQHNIYDDPWLAEIYDSAYSFGRRDIPFWLAAAKEFGGPLLELACGTGRVAIPLARAGFDVVGLDISEQMLAVARRKLEKELPEVQSRLRLMQADMRDFSLDRQFSLIIIPYRSFQALLDRSDQKVCLQCCNRHLKPGGLVAIDVFNTRLARLVVRRAGVHLLPKGLAEEESRESLCLVQW